MAAKLDDSNSCRGKLQVQRPLSFLGLQRTYISRSSFTIRGKTSRCAGLTDPARIAGDGPETGRAGRPVGQRFVKSYYSSTGMLSSRLGLSTLSPRIPPRHALSRHRSPRRSSGRASRFPRVCLPPGTRRATLAGQPTSCREETTGFFQLPLAKKLNGVALHPCTLSRSCAAVVIDDCSTLTSGTQRDKDRLGLPPNSRLHSATGLQPTVYSLQSAVYRR